jgi:hypothetical protein
LIQLSTLSSTWKGRKFLHFKNQWRVFDLLWLSLNLCDFCLIQLIMIHSFLFFNLFRDSFTF